MGEIAGQVKEYAAVGAVPLDVPRRLGHRGGMIEERLNAVAMAVETVLEGLLGEASLPGETLRPARLVSAMRHGALGGGKRLRPFLVVETSALFSVLEARAIAAGAALELVHCYSLVHDDLPAMDDDDLRRGRPTVHRAYDEATAILAGDGLLTLAFDAMARENIHPDQGVRLQLVTGLARAAGLGGMAGGQMLDLAAEGRFETAPAEKDQEEQAVRTLQAMKTGALLRFACEAGAILGQAAPAERAALAAYGEAIGSAFQVADDLIDFEGDSGLAGKAVGKDAARGKATLVALKGPDWARAELERLVAAAGAALERFGQKALPLKAAARAIAFRTK